jgi:hypothetical protein
VADQGEINADIVDLVGHETQNGFSKTRQRQGSSWSHYRRGLALFAGSNTTALNSIETYLGSADTVRSAMKPPRK